MKKANIIKAWKDPEYRASLTEEELKSLPEHPVDTLDSEELQKIKGGVVPQRGTLSRTNGVGAGGCGLLWSISAECNGGTSCNPFGAI